MRKRVDQTLRYFAGIINHQTARTNAARASDTLRQRREDQERVDEYLREHMKGDAWSG